MKTLLLLFSTIISFVLLAQPANDLCSNATTLACGTTNLAGTTVASVAETAPPTCGTSQNGVWYTFVGDGNATVISITGTGGFDPRLGVYSGTCASKTFVSCVDATGGNGIETTGSMNTVNGTVYYVWVAHYNSSTTGTFTITRQCAPSNDLCANATSLACGTSNLAGSTVATASETAPTGCGSSQYGVWYTFVGDGNISVISITGTGGFDPRLGVYTGTCASKTLVTCVDATGGNGTETTGNISTLNGTTYFVWVAYYSTGTTTGNFTISRTCIIPPSNDACANAIDMPCGTTNLAGTTINAVPETAPPTCGSSQYGVWYKFTGNGTLNTITLQGLGGFDTELGIYTGTCGSLTNVTCLDAVGASNPEVYSFTPTNGVTYYVYVAYYTSGTTTGNFTISRACPTPPVNDLCANAIDLVCGTTNLAGSTINSSAETAPPTCGSSQYGVWYKFTGNGSLNTITLQGLGGFDTELGIYTGTCGAFTNVTCLDAVGASNPEVYTFTPTNGVTYYIYVAYYTSGTTTGNFTISRDCPTPPANDLCANATDLPCGTVNMAGTTVNTGAETAPPTCGSSQYGVWYKFTGNGSINTITLQAGAGYDTELGIYTGTCGAFTNVTCLDAVGASNPEVYTFTPTNGVTYYIYVAYYSTGTNTGTFTISRDCPPPPVNDACANATSIACGSTLAGSTIASSSETLPPSCAGFISNYGVWYTFVGDGNNTNLTLQAGSGFDTGMAIYSGTCASLNQLYCLDAVGASNPEIQNFSTTNGTTYYMYVSYYNDASSNTGNFTLARTCTPAGTCVTATNNDYCPYPAQLTAGPGTFSATTDGTFTADQIQIDSEGSGIFCGSIENNSWYQFTASGTTASFPISSVTGCNDGYGIQGQVYEIGYNINGCCVSFTSKSNCFNPATATTGTITATGLTPGNQYVLMIDGFAGDGCDFTISNWSAIGILPVEFLTFSGHAESNGNVLNWSTASEINNDYFEVKHSRDGVHFNVVGIVNGAGTTQIQQDYEFTHQGELAGVNYYQIEQVDIDGKRKGTQIISIKSENNVEGLQSLFPNPCQESTNLSYFSSTSQMMTFQLVDAYGHSVIQKDILLNVGQNTVEIILANYPSGLYNLLLQTNEGIKNIKLIKN